MLKIHLVDQDDPEQMEKVQRFAATFAHTVAKSEWPLYIYEKDGEPLGYFHLCTVSVIHPAMKPGSIPRDVYDMIHTVRVRAAGIGNPVGVLVPPGSNFTAGMMQKLGFYTTDNVLYTDQPKT